MLSEFVLISLYITWKEQNFVLENSMQQETRKIPFCSLWICFVFLDKLTFAVAQYSPWKKSRFNRWFSEYKVLGWFFF